MNNAQDELNSLLGIEPEKVAEASEEAPATVALDQAAANIEALLRRIDAAPEDKRVPALLGGLAALVDAARAEGPAIVSHLADQMRSHALDRLS